MELIYVSNYNYLQFFKKNNNSIKFKKISLKHDWETCCMFGKHTGFFLYYYQKILSNLNST